MATDNRPVDDKGIPLMPSEESWAMMLGARERIDRTLKKMFAEDVARVSAPSGQEKTQK